MHDDDAVSRSAALIATFWAHFTKPFIWRPSFLPFLAPELWLGMCQIAIKTYFRPCITAKCGIENPSNPAPLFKVRLRHMNSASVWLSNWLWLSDFAHWYPWAVLRHFGSCSKRYDRQAKYDQYSKIYRLMELNPLKWFKSLTYKMEDHHDIERKEEILLAHS